MTRHQDLSANCKLARRALSTGGARPRTPTFRRRQAAAPITQATPTTPHPPPPTPRPSPPPPPTLRRPHVRGRAERRGTAAVQGLLARTLSRTLAQLLEGPQPPEGAPPDRALGADERRPAQGSRSHSREPSATARGATTAPPSPTTAPTASVAWPGRRHHRRRRPLMTRHLAAPPPPPSTGHGLAWRVDTGAPRAARSPPPSAAGRARCARRAPTTTSSPSSGATPPVRRPSHAPPDGATPAAARRRRVALLPPLESRTQRAARRGLRAQPRLSAALSSVAEVSSPELCPALPPRLARPRPRPTHPTSDPNGTLAPPTPRPSAPRRQCARRRSSPSSRSAKCPTRRPRRRPRPRRRGRRRASAAAAAAAAAAPHATELRPAETEGCVHGAPSSSGKRCDAAAPRPRAAPGSLLACLALLAGAGGLGAHDALVRLGRAALPRPERACARRSHALRGRSTSMVAPTRPRRGRRRRRRRAAAACPGRAAALWLARHVASLLGWRRRPSERAASSERLSERSSVASSSAARGSRPTSPTPRASRSAAADGARRAASRGLDHSHPHGGGGGAGTAASAATGHAAAALSRSTAGARWAAGGWGGTDGGSLYERSTARRSRRRSRRAPRGGAAARARRAAIEAEAERAERAEAERAEAERAEVVRKAREEERALSPQRRPEGAGGGGAEGEAEEARYCPSCQLRFGALDAGAHQHHHVRLSELQVLLAPGALAGFLKYSFAVRAFHRELSGAPFPPPPFEAGDVHTRLELESTRVWLPVDQSSLLTMTPSPSPSPGRSVRSGVSKYSQASDSSTSSRGWHAWSSAADLMAAPPDAPHSLAARRPRPRSASPTRRPRRDGRAARRRRARPRRSSGRKQSPMLQIDVGVEMGQMTSPSTSSMCRRARAPPSPRQSSGCSRRSKTPHHHTHTPIARATPTPTRTRRWQDSPTTTR